MKHLIIALVLLTACAEQQLVDSTSSQAEKAVITARENMDTVAAVLEAAEPALHEAPTVNAELVAFREADEAGEYSKALGHLRKALDAAIKAGLEVPPEVPERLGQAELLLELVGK